MPELITKIECSTRKPLTGNQAALPQFCFENGYVLQGTDLGGRGVKLELVDKHEGAASIILPPRKAEECAKWLLRTLGQTKYTLPDELPAILQRIIRQKQLSSKLRRGEKKKIQDTLKVLKSR